MSRGVGREAAVESVATALPGLPRTVSQALNGLHVATQTAAVRQVTLKELVPGMILDEDLVTPKGIRLVSQGREVTRTLIIRLTSIAQRRGRIRAVSRATSEYTVARQRGGLTQQAPRDCVGRHRSIDQVPLHLITTQKAQDLRLLLGLRSFGNHTELQRVRQSDHG